jgi:hypothetical protein
LRFSGGFKRLGQYDLLFEPVFRRICSNDLSFHAENTIKEIDLSHSSITTDTAMFILERFPLLEELNIVSCEKVYPADLAQSLYTWIWSQKISLESLYCGRKIALQRFIFGNSLRNINTARIARIQIEIYLTEICVGPVVVE